MWPKSENDLSNPFEMQDKAVWITGNASGVEKAGAARCGAELVLHGPGQRAATEPMRQTTRVMPGYVVVAPEGVASDDDLRAWLAMALDFVGTLPAKSGKKPPARPRKPTTAPQRSRA